MPFDLLLLPLLGGYWFALKYNYTTYQAKRESRDRLIFLVATCGLALLAASFIFTRLVIFTFPCVVDLWKRFVPWDYSGTTFGALILGFVLPLIFNFFCTRDKGNIRAIKRFGNSLERLFYECVRSGQLVIVTTQSRKVYIGYLKRIPVMHRDDGYLRILPIQSGYRAQDTLALDLDTNYSAVYESMMEEADLRGEDVPVGGFDSFIRVIPIQSIVSAGAFDPELYGIFHSDESSSRQPIQLQLFT